MKKLIELLPVILCVFYNFISHGQAIPPDVFSVNIVESIGAGCHDTTDHQAGKICFDVEIKVNKPNWKLQSYNIWMDYGPDSTVLSYHSDQSCVHQDGGDLDFNSLGKYRFLAANAGLLLQTNVASNFHNFCLDIQMFSGMHNLDLTPGGEHYGLVSSVNLIDASNSSNAINLIIESGDPFDLGESSFHAIDPFATAACDPTFLDLSALPVDATGPGILDCEPYLFLWLGPNGFQVLQSDTILVVNDPVAQSGLYELYVVGNNGCQGYESFQVDFTSCSVIACDDLNYVSGPIALTESQQARMEIIVGSDVVIAENLTFSAPKITFMSNFEVPMGVSFETDVIGCP